MPKSEDQKARARERYQERRQDPAYLAKRRAQGREAQARINHPDRIQRNNLNQRLKRKQRPEGEEDIEAENQSQPDNPGSDRRSPIASESSQVVTIKQLAAGSILAGTSWDEPSTFPNLSPPIPGSLRPGPSSNQLVGQEGVAESNATVLPLPRFSEGSHLLAQKKGDTGNSSGHTEPTSTLDHSSGPRGPVGAGVVAPTRVPNLNEISYLHQLSHLYSATPELAGDSEHTRTPVSNRESSSLLLPPLPALTSPDSPPSVSALPERKPHLIPPPEPPAVDLLSDVLGKQVHARAETVVWPCGWKTVLPTLMMDNKNILEADAECVRWMANTQNAVPSERSRVKYLDRSAYGTDDLPEYVLIEDIQRLNAQNYVVVVPVAIPETEWTIKKREDPEHGFGYDRPANLTLKYQDLSKRIVDDPSLKTVTTVPNFIKNIYNPDAVGVMPNVPFTRPFPEPFDLCGDDEAAWRHISVDTSHERHNFEDLLVDLRNLIHTQGQLHHAGVVTSACQYEDGYNVVRKVAGDRDDPRPMMWVIISFKDPSMMCLAPEAIAAFLRYMRLDGDSEDRAGFELDDSIRENCLVEVIYLRPGDFIFQPPGVMYLVYTPAATAAWGSHSYSYHTMHLTEWTRKVQHFLSDNTDQEPTPVRQNLYAMMINLPNFANEVFYTRSIAALCKMVLHENDYLASRQPRCEGNEFERVAKNVAMVVARLCLGASTPNTMNLPPKMRLAVERLAIVQHLDQILTEGNYDDPGKSFTLEEQVLLAVEELEESDKLTL